MTNDTKINLTMTFSDLKKIWLHPDDTDIIQKILSPIINEKMQKLQRRELYTRYKTAESEAEREEARQRYLDEASILPDSRW